MTILPRYTRDDPRGRMPRRVNGPELAANRLGLFWRPIIDLADSAFAASRLRAIPVVAAALADPGPDRWPWFSRIGVPGLRHQVLRHAGLDAYDCAQPRELPEQLRSPGWSVLVAAIECFPELSLNTRAMLVFHLAQLSYCQLAITLAGLVEPTGAPSADRYAYEVARVHARFPQQVRRAQPVFAALAARAQDPSLRLAACFQGIGHALRDLKDLPQATEFARRGAEVDASPETWHDHLVRSRFHRALALLRLAEGADPTRQLDRALAHQAIVEANPVDRLVAQENARYLLELRIQIAQRAEDPELLRWCEDLRTLDPNCPEALLTVGDGYAARADYATAARHYARAGEFGTGAGALGWFRAGQCYQRLDDQPNAITAMGRCLELDAAAIEPKRYLASARSA